MSLDRIARLYCVVWLLDSCRLFLIRIVVCTVLFCLSFDAKFEAWFLARELCCYANAKVHAMSAYCNDHKIISKITCGMAEFNVKCLEKHF